MNTVNRLFDVPYYAMDTYNLEDLFVTKQNNKWIKTSNSEFIEKAVAVSKALIHLGIQPNDKIALISTNNRTEWNIMDTAVLQIGAQTVPIYPTISEDEFEYIFNHSEVTYCFLSDQMLFDKITSIKNKIPLIKDIYTFDTIKGAKNLSELIELGKSLQNEDELEKRKSAVKTDDLATIIYTSGTTGKPKGVMLSHKNIISNFMGCQDRVPLKIGKDRAMSFLPCCHVYERMLLYLYQYNGIAVYFAESIDKIAANIVEVKPNVMCVVPRLLEKVYDAIIAKGTALTGFKKKIFFWAVAVGEKYEPYHQNGWWYDQKLKMAQKLVLSKWKEGLGGNLDLIVSGSAPLQQRLGKIFSAAGMLVMEGYGLTETSPVISVNSMADHGFKYGTVGKPLSNLEVKIAADGEILVKGDSIMLGYYKDEEKTGEVLKDGFFYTEDIGELDKEGFLKITDRKKEMFKTSGGKYITPQSIENKMKESRFIEQIMVVGEGEKMPAAFIQPDFNFLKEWAKRKNITIGTTNKEIVTNEKVIERYKKVLDSINPSFGHWEQIKKFELTPDVWGVDNGLLTPTLKLKRKIIKEKYKDLYAKMFQK